MKYVAALGMAALFFAGCGAEILTATAISGQLQKEQVGAMKRNIDHAKDTTGRTATEQAIRTFQAEKGHHPPSLEALVPQYLAEVPRKADGSPYGYDPTTGRLLDGPAPGGMPPADQQTMNQIRSAINQYGTATGYYPGTLDDLAPHYLPVPPRTQDGRPFHYNNQTGEVRHPGTPGGAAPGPGARVPAGGAGPLGEAMTGIAIQNQLGNMSQGGANAAGTRGRDQARGVPDSYGDNQVRALDQLGL